MSSHVPFLAVRPDDQFSSDVKPKKPSKSSVANAVALSQSMDSPPPLTPAPKVKEVARIPASLRFPILCLLSFSLSTLFHTLTADITGIQLATASRAAHSPWEISVLLGWRLFGLLTAWVAGYDCKIKQYVCGDSIANFDGTDEDLTALTLLVNQPYYYLLHAFWSVELVSVAISLIFDVAVVAVPFALLRPLNRRLEPNTPRTTNQALATDWQIMVLTAVLGATVYAVTFFLSYQTNFSVFLINHFDDLPTLEAHDSTIPQLLQLFVVTGCSAMLFLFRPTIAASGKALPQPRTRKPRKFNPETATLSETLAHNIKFIEAGWSQRTVILARRTAVLTLCTLANTFVRVYGTVEGTDILGSLGYGGLWSAATILVGVSYGLLSQE